MELKDTIKLFPRFRVAIVGDLMLDKYVFGDATRISQEAPVPVVHVQQERSVPGGAANVARNVVSLGAQAEVFGGISRDYDGEILRRHLSDAGIVTDGIVALDDRCTTVKTRILAGKSQQVVRVDYENTSDYPRKAQQAILGKLSARLATGEIHAVILEDYAKGLFTHRFMERVVELARKYHVPTALDPHSSHAFNVKGISIMTPNRSEAFALAAFSQEPMPSDSARDTKLVAVGRKLLSQWGLEHLLITLGANGMALFAQGHADEFQTIPTVARQVFDVSGAGDTVMASIVLALLAKAPIADACRISNVAAGIVVGRIGTSAIEADVLAQAL